MPIGFEWIIIAIMLVLNAILAAYEMALASISRARLLVLVNQKKKGAEDAAYMKDRIEASLAVIQVGITLVGAIAAATGGSGLADSLIPYLHVEKGFPLLGAKILALLIFIVPLGTLTIISAELIPKTFALENRELVCLRVSPPMRILSQFFYPGIRILELIVKKGIDFSHRISSIKRNSEDHSGLHELNAAATMARTAKLIGAREEKIVLSAAQLSVRPVKEIMIPAHDIFMIPVGSSLNEALVRAHLDMHTRFPVCEQEADPQTIIGYINFKDIIMALKFDQQNPSFRSIIRPIKSVSGTTPISQSLEQMMLEKLHIALVRDPEQKIIGMITLEDIIEEMVGEIEDEFDRLPNQIHSVANGWIMGGGVPMDMVAKTLGIEGNIDAFKPGVKLADWCTQNVSAPLQGGEIIRKDRLQITVRKLRRQKLAEALVSLI